MVQNVCAYPMEFNLKCVVCGCVINVCTLPGKEGRFFVLDDILRFIHPNITPYTGNYGLVITTTKTPGGWCIGDKAYFVPIKCCQKQKLNLNGCVRCGNKTQNKFCAKCIAFSSICVEDGVVETGRCRICAIECVGTLCVLCRPTNGPDSETC